VSVSFDTLGKFYGIEGSLFDMDEAFVDLIDTPAVLVTDSHGYPADAD